MVSLGDRGEGFALGHDVCCLCGKLFGLDRFPGATLLFHKRFERGIDLDDASIEFIVRFPKGCPDLRILKRNLSNLIVFLCQVAAAER